MDVINGSILKNILLLFTLKKSSNDKYWRFRIHGSTLRTYDLMDIYLFKYLYITQNVYRGHKAPLKQYTFCAFLIKSKFISSIEIIHTHIIFIYNPKINKFKAFIVYYYFIFRKTDLFLKFVYHQSHHFSTIIFYSRQILNWQKQIFCCCIEQGKFN